MLNNVFYLYTHTLMTPFCDAVTNWVPSGEKLQQRTPSPPPPPLLSCETNLCGLKEEHANYRHVLAWVYLNC